MSRRFAISAGSLLMLVACSDGTSPASRGNAPNAADQLDHLADSVATTDTPGAEALRHAAAIVRLTGHSTPITLTVDGVQRGFEAVAEQIEFPLLACTWPGDSGIAVPGDSGVTVPGDSGSAGGGGTPMPGDSTVPMPGDTVLQMPGDSVLPPPDSVRPPPDSGIGGGGGGGGGECTVVGTSAMRTLIAWEPEHLAEVVRIVSEPGPATVGPSVPDVMTGLPTAPDSVGPAPGDTTRPGIFPGFLGEYFVRDQGSWWAVEGTQSNALEELTGSCTSDRALFDWAEFACTAARFHFAFDMRVANVLIDPLPGSGGAEDHRLAFPGASIDGVRLLADRWSAPPPPVPMPPEGVPTR